MNKAQEKKRLKLTLIKSPYGRVKGHDLCVHGLGLKRMHQTVIVEDTPAIRGLIYKVSYLLTAEEV